MKGSLEAIPMKNALALVAVVVAMLAAGTVAAQGPPGRCRGQGMPVYDPATEATREAVVEAVEKVDCCCPRGGTGTHLTLNIDGSVTRAHLGPSDFLAEKRIELAKGDELGIVGSRVKWMGEEVILARTIRKGDLTITLRDEKGAPAWAGRGRAGS
jgi:hypothetical protein